MALSTSATSIRAVCTIILLSNVLNVLNTADLHKLRYLYIMDDVHEQQHGQAIRFQVRMVSEYPQQHPSLWLVADKL